MPDNSDDELLDNPIKTQSENLPDEIIPAKDTETIKPNLESENMEIHHHPDLHHKSKPGKEYFLEFLMIFLAVTLGFFAENLREHYVENERAEQYAHSLYDDFKADTATIQRTYDEKEWIQSKFDSAEIILASNDLSKNNEFIYYMLHTFQGRYLQTTDTTINKQIDALIIATVPKFNLEHNPEINLKG